jgi:hypothetical protein
LPAAIAVPAAGADAGAGVGVLAAVLLLAPGTRVPKNTLRPSERTQVKCADELLPLLPLLSLFTSCPLVSLAADVACTIRLAELIEFFAVTGVELDVVKSCMTGLECKYISADCLLILFGFSFSRDVCSVVTFSM